MGAVCGGVPVGGPLAAALVASVAGVPLPAEVGWTAGLAVELELGLEVDDKGELGLLIPGDPDGPLGPDPPPRLGAAGAGGAGEAGPAGEEGTGPAAGGEAVGRG
jgi:hypothetical protein